MEFRSALRRFMREQKFNDAHIAIAAGVSTSGVRKWLAGTAQPRYNTAQKLRKAYPRLAKILDEKVA